MYILSNGVKITEKMHQCLCQAIKDTSQKYTYFLDMETGKLIRIPCKHRQKLAAIKKKSQRFIPLPTVSEAERRRRFVAFVEELGIIDVPKLQSRLSKEIKKGESIDGLEQILKNDPSGWIHGWVQDEQFLLAERIEEWITEPPLSAKDDPDYWFFDDCPVCQLMKKMEQGGGQPKASELRDAFDEAKKKGAVVGGELMEENGLEYVGNAKDFKMPKWMECTWRRAPCGKDDCPICGRIKKDRQKHIEKGEDPDDPKFTIEDIGQNLKEALQIIKEDAESRGFDITNIKDIQEPPQSKEFPLYNKVEEWNKSVRALENTAEASAEFWLHTEEAADLFWYANILMARTYRQLCNKWHIKNGDDYGEFDRQYTGCVLKECLEILKKSFKGLADSYPQKQGLNSLYLTLLKLEKEIIKI